MSKDDIPKKSLRAAFTEKMVAALKEDKIPWRQPWTGQGSPHNALTGKPYKGGNRMILAIAGMEHGYTDPRYVTFNQAKTMEGSVRKGEHATAIEYWESKPFYTRRDVTLTANGAPIYIDGKREIVGDKVPLKGGATLNKSNVVVEYNDKKYAWRQAESELNMLVAKTHFLFNIQQCDNLKLEPLGNGVVVDQAIRGEQIAQGMVKDGLAIIHGAGGAYYQPGADAVSMPPRETFKSVEGYYGTLLHELGHATGHTARLNRDGVTKGGLSNAFGSPGYAKEELVAEMTSAFIAMDTGIPFDDDNHKAYIQSWAEVLSKDENAIFRAAKEAGAAADYMLARESDGLTQEHEHVTLRDAVNAIPAMRAYVSPTQLEVMGNASKGKEGQFFKDKFVELAKIIDDMPATFEQTGTSLDSVVYLHYANGDKNWYVTGKDALGDGTSAVYGHKGLGQGISTMPFRIDINELVKNGAELDLHFDPMSLSQCVPLQVAVMDKFIKNHAQDQLVRVNDGNPQSRAEEMRALDINHSKTQTQPVHKPKPPAVLER